MDQTVREIEAHIDRTRDRLGSNLQELEDKVDAATDWREQFRSRPFAVLGVACVAGALVGAALQTRPRRPALQPPSQGYRPSPLRRIDAEGQLRDLWDNIRGALLGVAAARVQRYIGEAIPGFDEEYQRAAQRRSHPA
jgi:hypothetical protein